MSDPIDSDSHELGESIQAERRMALRPATYAESDGIVPFDPKKTPSSRNFVDDGWTGREVRERPGFPFFAVFCLCLGSLGLFSITSPDKAPAVIGPAIGLSFAAVFSARWFRPTRYRVTETALEVSSPQATIPFSEMTDVVAANPLDRRDFVIEILRPTAIFSIDRRLECPSSDFLMALQHRVSGVRPETPMMPLFEQFLKQQRMLHNDHEIRVFRGASKRRDWGKLRSDLRAALAFALPIPLFFTLWLAFPRNGFEFAAMACGGLAVSAGLLGLVVQSQVRQVRNPEAAVLIITPSGLALSQGDLRGELRWREVKKVSLRTIQSWRLSSQQPGLALTVAGAEILIEDVYDYPIHAISRIVEAYHRPEQ